MPPFPTSSSPSILQKVDGARRSGIWARSWARSGGLGKLASSSDLGEAQYVKGSFIPCPQSPYPGPGFLP